MSGESEWEVIEEKTIAVDFSNVHVFMGDYLSQLAVKKENESQTGGVMATR